MKKVNYVVYHRNNRMLQLINHFEIDGDLDANYLMLRNSALTGKFIGKKFISKIPKRLRWLKECSNTKIDGQYCRLCSGIFKSNDSNDYEITDFYKTKVVKIDENVAIPHPLTDYIINKFEGDCLD